MDREQLGKEININLAIQGQLEGANSDLQGLINEKAAADKVVEAGKQAEIESNKLAVKIKKLQADKAALEKSLVESDEKLAAAKAKVPRLIREDVTPPTSIRL